MLEQLDFAQSSLGQDLLAENIGDLLYGHALTGLYVGCRTGTKSSVMTAATSADPRHLPDDTISTLAQLFGDIVVLVHDEILVEDLEDFATLQLSHDGSSTVVKGMRGNGQEGGRGRRRRDRW